MMMDIAAFGLAGLLVGSFLNVVIYRLSANDRGSIIAPRSYCPHCGAPIAWYDNMPLISFMVLRGRCRHCGGRIAWRYPLVEAVTMATWVGVAYLYAGNMAATMAWGYFASLAIALTAIDLETYTLPDELTYALIWGGLTYHALYDAAALREGVFGAVAGYAAFWGIRAGYALLRKREGLGGGDVKLFAALGAWFGVWALPHILLAASLMGVAYGALLMLRARRIQAEFMIAFGPWLLAASMGYAVLSNVSLTVTLARLF